MRANPDLKCRVMSSCHKCIDEADPRWKDLSEFLFTLHKTYGMKNPLRFAICCDVILIPKRAGSYIKHREVQIMFKDRVLENEAEAGIKLKAILARAGKVHNTHYLYPGLDLTCQIYTDGLCIARPTPPPEEGLSIRKRKPLPIVEGDTGTTPVKPPPTLRTPGKSSIIKIGELGTPTLKSKNSELKIKVPWRF